MDCSPLNGEMFVSKERRKANRLLGTNLDNLHDQGFQCSNMERDEREEWRESRKLERVARHLAFSIMVPRMPLANDKLGIDAFTTIQSKANANVRISTCMSGNFREVSYHIMMKITTCSCKYHAQYNDESLAKFVDSTESRCHHSA